MCFPVLFLSYKKTWKNGQKTVKSRGKTDKTKENILEKVDSDSGLLPAYRLCGLPAG